MILTFSILLSQREGLVGRRRKQQHPCRPVVEELMRQLCGFAAVFDVEEVSEALELVQDHQVRLEGLHARLGELATQLGDEHTSAVL